MKNAKQNTIWQVVCETAGRIDRQVNRLMDLILGEKQWYWYCDHCGHMEKTDKPRFVGREGKGRDKRHDGQ